jgi:hypothetical protein
MQNFKGLKIKFLALMVLLSNTLSVEAAVISSSNVRMSRELAKALMAPVSISKTKFGTRLNLTVGARYESEVDSNKEELVVNFEDNNIDKDSETLIFSRGEVVELDSNGHLPSFLVDASGAHQESYCTLKLNRALAEHLNRGSENRWTLKEGSIFRINPYTPAAQRSQMMSNRVQLNLELVTTASGGSALAQSVTPESLRCEIYLGDGVEDVENRLLPELEKVLSTWLRFQVSDSSGFSF